MKKTQIMRYFNARVLSHSYLRVLILTLHGCAWTPLKSHISDDPKYEENIHRNYSISHHHSTCHHWKQPLFNTALHTIGNNSHLTLLPPLKCGEIYVMHQVDQQIVDYTMSCIMLSIYILKILIISSTFHRILSTFIISTTSYHSLSLQFHHSSCITIHLI